MPNRSKNYSWVGWGLGALAYYCLLACFRYTWVFASGDSGDWLASARLWFAPQPYGSPLYILLAKLVGLTKDSLALQMTFWLSCLPAALSVGFVYQAVKNLGGQAKIAGLVMLGAVVLTSQAGVIEEYALAVMFLSLAILAYSANRRNLTVIALALGCAVHVIMFPITFVFYLVHYREWRVWLKTLPLFFIFGVLPYTLTLLLIAYAPYAWIAEKGLAWQHLNSYFGSTGTIGKLALRETPLRLLYLASFMLACFGAALIPAIRHALINRKNQLVAFLFLVVCFSAWLYLTDTDPTTWTFLVYAVPCVSVLTGLGISQAKPERYLVVFTTLVLIISSFWLANARLLDRANPKASDFYAKTLSLPDGAYVLTQRGGWYTFTVMYAIAEGKDLNIVFDKADIKGQAYTINAAGYYENY